MTAARRWLKQTLRDRSRRARVWTRAWLRAHPRLRHFLARTGSLDVDEFTLARGVAVGLFIALTPTIGVQTLLMLAAAPLLRANFPAAFLASWINNPLTFPAFYFGFYQLGERLVPLLPIRYDSLSGLEAELAWETTTLVVGSLAVAAPVALLGYFAFLQVWRRFHLHLPYPLPESVEREKSSAKPE